MEASAKLTNVKRLNRDQWLAKALDILAEQGGWSTIDDLVGSLGLTKGSFYWHFKDRSNFMLVLAEFWEHRSTLVAGEMLDAHSGSAKERLYALMDMVYRGSLAKYDLAIRSLALREPAVKAVLRRADEFRYRHVRALLAEMGFQGKELDMRARMVVCFESNETALALPVSNKTRSEQLKLRHKWYTEQ